jgi:glycosyltransferase involved in cell wall biosynthesis
MNILLLSTVDRGGAGSATMQLYQDLVDRGHNANLLVGTKFGHQNNNLLYFRDYSNRYLWYLRRKFEKILPKTSPKYKTHPDYYFLSIGQEHNKITAQEILAKVPCKPDLIILGLVDNFIDPDCINQLYKLTNAPMIWVLLDMAPMTGGCHYAWDCEGYTKVCGKCPGLFSHEASDLSYQNLAVKRKAMDQIDLTIIAPSEWLFRQCRKSAIFRGKPIYKILLSINPNLFNISDKTIAKRHFAISAEKRVLFIAADSLEERRKGFRYLLDSLQIHNVQRPESKNEVRLLIAGKVTNLDFSALPFEYSYVGRLNTAELATAYQAADIFVCPSIEDSGPMMINEAIMSGTPVVSFEMGVALDLVYPRQTGYRARLRDSHDLARGIREILSLSKDDYQSMSQQCRKIALRLCSPEVQGNNLENIIKKHVAIPYF